VANDWEINAGMGRGTRDTPWQWRTTWGKFGTDYEGLRKWILGYKFAELKTASAITGIPEEKIRQAAEILAKPGPDGKRSKTSFMLEKGNYWSNNYLNTISFATLALICGAGNRPGQVISRGGGHQRGWMGAAGYPLGKAGEKFPGRRRKPIDLDRWVVDGNVRFAWVIGTTWLQAMAGSQELMDAFNRLTRGNPHQIQSFDKEDAVRTLIQRADSGGMVVVDSDLYLIDPLGSQFADIVLPAAGWGEDDFTRCNGERRLRLYSKFFDPPGEARADWWAVAQFAKRMGFEGYDWKESNDIFEEAARFGRGSVLNYHPLVVRAKEQGMKGHELLRKYGTEGIQTPIRLVDGKLVGTKRLHDPANEIGTPVGATVHQRWLTSFNTHSGKAILHKAPWEEFADFFEAEVKPAGDELFITNGRINELWQSGYDCLRQAYKRERWPDNFLEIHPEDARTRGIESGDLVEVVNDRVPSQTGGYWGVDDPDLSYTELKKRGLFRYTKASFQAVAIVTDGVKQGVAFTNFLWTASPANSIVPRVVDPFTNNYRYKLGKGRIRKIGESPFKRDLSAMSFIPRTL
jgi:arsenite oxidase large subunit